MKASQHVKKVMGSAVFKDFMKEDPKAYLCSLFCVRAFNGEADETQVDFYSPGKKEIISFKLEKGIERIPVNKKAETLTHKKFVPKPLEADIKMDADKLGPTLLDEMHNRGMTYEVTKLLAFLTIVDGEAVWNCTGFLKGLGLIQAHIEDSSGTVLFMDKKSFFDLMRVVPGDRGKQQSQQSQITSEKKEQDKVNKK